MDGTVRKVKHLPKIVIPNHYVTGNIDTAQILPVVSKPGIMKSFVTTGLDGAELIPVSLGGRLAQPSISVNELGKQLLKASVEGNTDEIKMLMNKGAPFTADWLGTSPLHFAAQHNHLEVCEILLRAGISKDARTKVDRTPLHIAAYEGHVDIVKCLLDNKADVDSKDLLAMTPLHWAAQNGHAEVAKCLVRYGAQKDVINKFSFTPIDIAAQIDRPDIVEMIANTSSDLCSLEQNLSVEINREDVTVEFNKMDHSSELESCSVEEVLETETNVSSSIDTVFLEDIDSENSIDPERLHINQEDAHNNNHTLQLEHPQVQPIPQISDKFQESMKILQEHGITMLPADDSNILSSILETGHSMVLTDIGKEVLESTKPIVNRSQISEVKLKPKVTPPPIKPKRIITMTSQEFVAMALNQNNVLKQVNGKLVSSAKPTVKRIVMKKNKIIPITVNSNIMKIHKQEHPSDIEMLMNQLIEARKLVEEYKQKFLKKEAEAERYKEQLRLITQSHNRG